MSEDRIYPEYVRSSRAKLAEVFGTTKVECQHCLLWVTSLEGHLKEHPLTCGCHAIGGVA